ncbi:GatB/YqeY domain-containing protein [candidate division KSB1 bacterium]|nr:GatB/YqeY domain-containing protein [candidate division KSB1 bacterium]
MSIQEKLMDDLKSAMKSGDSFKRDTLRLLISQIKYARINKGHDLSLEEEISVLLTASKNRLEAIEMYQQGGRDDLKDKEQRELAIISTYLPEQLSDAEVEQAITAAIAQLGATTGKDVGKVMSSLMKDLKGKVDGKKLQALVRQKLA